MAERLIWLVMSFSGLINLFMPISMAIDANCDYFQEVAVGSQYYIYSQNYPANYPPSTSCRWVAQSPSNSRIILTCEDINLPASTNCNGDRLSVSVTGRTDFSDAHNYCGKGTLSLVSDANALAVGLFSTWNSAGGRFLCSLTAVQDETNTPNPPSCDCGWRQQRRIIGGHETGINEYPAMAALIDLFQRTVYCGASIISTKYALTAAHCGREPSSIALLVGDHDITTGSDTNASALYPISNFYSHPSWSTSTYLNDIAVVQTTTIITFSNDVGPICLPFRYSTFTFTGDDVVALGWGLTEFSGPMSDTLQEVQLEVVNNTYCAQRYPNSQVIPSQLCTYAQGKDSCQGDSGGPLYFFESSIARLLQVGIISYGQACGTDNPAINTRVTSYLTWIVSATPDANYCIK